MWNAARSARERVEGALAQLERSQGALNAFVRVLDTDARRRAADLDERGGSGAFHGIPVAVKDLIDVNGAPTTGGCSAYRERMADGNAAVVTGLEKTGAVIVGKTNLHELGAGATGLVSSFGPTRNPWDLDRIAGGSSSGSAAAVAAGIVPLALGTDTGGSVRIPASFCGITGLKPTTGRVPLDGVLPMSLQFDTVGPLAQTASLCAAAMSAMALGSPRPGGPGLDEGLQVGLPAAYFTRLHRETSWAVRQAAGVLSRLGADVQATEGPPLDEDASGFAHLWSDFAHHHRDVLQSGEVSPEIHTLLRTGAEMTDEAVLASRRRASELRTQFLAALEQVDVLLTPTTPYPAPRADQDQVAVRGGHLDVHHGGPSRFTFTINETGLPAISFPVAPSSDGLPIGAQLIGPPNSDERLLAIVEEFQQVTDYHRHRPPEGGTRNRHPQAESG